MDWAITTAVTTAQNDIYVAGSIRRCKMMAATIVTFWGVYPIGYILTCFQVVDLNWIHLSFSVADIINKVGVGIIAYIAAKQVVEKRVADDATAPAYMLS